MHAQLNIALTAARQGARILAQQVDRLDRVRVLDQTNGVPVTSAHRDIEHAVLYQLQKTNSAYGFQSPISGQTGNPEGRTQWLIEPLFGIDCFLRGSSGCGVSIACQVDGQVQHSVLIDPLLNEEFTASRGSGANLNTRRLRVSQNSEPDKCLVALEFPAIAGGRPEMLRLLQKLVEAGSGIRSSGSGIKDILDTAATRLDGGCIITPGPQALAAVLLILLEAGGLISDKSGNPRPDGDLLLFGNARSVRFLLKFSA